MKTRRLTVGQAVVEFLAGQYSERDGVERRFVPGMKEKGWGRIVNVSSTTATHVWGILIDYGTAKSALNISHTCSRARSSVWLS